MSRQEYLLRLFSESDILYHTLNCLIAEYDTPIDWETTAFTSWKQKDPTGIVNYKDNLFTCDWDQHTVAIYTLQGEKINEISSFDYPYGIDFDNHNKFLYIADKYHVTILNLKLEIMSIWKLPTSNDYYRGLKIDNNVLYLTIGGIHQIFLCNSSDGKILNKWGTVQGGSKQEEFSNPYGLTVNDKYLYVCDSWNDRIQIVIKTNGKFVNQWEKTESLSFHFPKSIYFHNVDDIFYIGDRCALFLLTRNGKFKQKLGSTIRGDGMDQFNEIDGICVKNERLYICDWRNNRIQIFKREN